MWYLAFGLNYRVQGFATILTIVEKVLKVETFWPESCYTCQRNLGRKQVPNWIQLLKILRVSRSLQPYQSRKYINQKVNNSLQRIHDAVSNFP